MHLSPDVGVTEVLRDDGTPAEPGEVGDLVVTGLLNVDHILIRYRQGDRGSLAPAGETCACGRTMPILASIEGRKDDVLVTPDGRKIGRLDPVFKASQRVREAQIVQEQVNRVRVKVVPGAGYDDTDARSIADRLRDRMGEIEVVIEVVERIPRTRNGKFRAVVSLLGKA
jgi:phenylacetate-CoA ligase